MRPDLAEIVRWNREQAAVAREMAELAAHCAIYPHQHLEGALSGR